MGCLLSSKIAHIAALRPFTARLSDFEGGVKLLRKRRTRRSDAPITSRLFILRFSFAGVVFPDSSFMRCIFYHFFGITANL